MNTATHCNTLQHTATHYNTGTNVMPQTQLQIEADMREFLRSRGKSRSARAEAGNFFLKRLLDTQSPVEKDYTAHF